jgi:hypothetical protein
MYIHFFYALRFAFEVPCDLQFERDSMFDVNMQPYLYLYDRIYYKLIPNLHIEAVKLQSFEMQIWDVTAHHTMVPEISTQ